MKFGTPLTNTATKVMLLGSGELGKEVVISLQRLGVEVIAVDRYANAPAHQVAHRAHVINMSNPDELRALIIAEKPHFIVPEIEAIATQVLVDIEQEGIAEVIPTARAVNLTMNREGIRRLAAEELGLPTSPYAFAESLEQEGDHKLSDDVLSFVSLSQNKQFTKTAQSKYNQSKISFDLNNTFLDLIKKYTKQENVSFENIVYIPDIILTLANSSFRNDFVKLAQQKLIYFHFMPLSTAQKYVRQFYKDTTNRIAKNIPKLEDLSLFISLCEKVLENHNLDSDFSSILDPNSYVYSYVFDQRSPAKKDILNQAKQKFGEEKLKLKFSFPKTRSSGK